jgi:AmpE protein
MILLSLLIALMMERVTTKSDYWQVNYYLDHYRQLLVKNTLLSHESSLVSLLLFYAVPAIAVFFVLNLLNLLLLELVASSVVLFICIGCPSLRSSYRGYLKAASRGDDEACELYQEQVGYKADNEINFGKFLVWVNYQHYAAIVLWFIFAGAGGAVFYVLARSLVNSQAFSADTPIAKHAETARFWLDIIPARITAFGLLLMGNFSRAMPIWLGYLVNFKVENYVLVTDVAKVAEDIEPRAKHCTEEPCSLVRLAKRNMLFLLVTTSILTITGWVA